MKLTEKLEKLFIECNSLGKDARISAFVQDAEQAIRDYNKEVIDILTQVETGQPNNWKYDGASVRKIKQRQEELL